MSTPAISFPSLAAMEGMNHWFPNQGSVNLAREVTNAIEIFCKTV